MADGKGDAEGGTWRGGGCSCQARTAPADSMPAGAEGFSWRFEKKSEPEPGGAAPKFSLCHSTPRSEVSAAMIDWRHWHNEPFLVGGLIIIGWLYAILTGPLRPWFGAALPYPAREARYFYAALLLFYLAVGSPLDQIGERFLFTAHMVQHQIVIYPAALCFLLGLPGWLLTPLAESTGLTRIGRFLTRPLVCGLIFVGTLSAWHVPALYDWALQDKTVHIIEHITFFAVALFLWWPFASPVSAWPAAGKGVQMIYIFFVTVGMTPVFAFIVFSNGVLYPTYEFAPRITTLSPMDDQILGGALMKLGGLTVSLSAFAWSFFRWHRDSEPAGNDSPRG